MTLRGACDFARIREVASRAMIDPIELASEFFEELTAIDTSWRASI
jgi:hypothetical protein